jgi:hypothetical protein
MGQPSLCIEKIHIVFFYFIYSTKTEEKALQQSYKLKPQNNAGVKTPPN